MTNTTLAENHMNHDIHIGSVPGTITSGDHAHVDTHKPDVSGFTPAEGQYTVDAHINSAFGTTTSDASQSHLDTPMSCARVGISLDGNHARFDAHTMCVPVTQSSGDQGYADTQSPFVSGITPDVGHEFSDAQIRPAHVTQSSGMNHSAIDTHTRPVHTGSTLDGGQRKHDAQPNVASIINPSDASHLSVDTQQQHACVGTTFAGDQELSDTQTQYVSGSQTSDTNHKRNDIQKGHVRVGQPLTRETIAHSTPTMPSSHAPFLFDPALGMLAQQLDDLEGLRKAQANRIRILTRTEVDSDGELRGFGLPEDNPNVVTLNKLFDGINALEHQTVLALQKEMRRHPLGAWQRSQKGVGEKTLARLLAIIGDPYIRLDNCQPRTVSQLWAYCGLHTIADPDGGVNIAAKRRKGVQSNWSTDAKTRAYLISESMVKAGVRKDENGNRVALSEYGQLYIDRRAHTDETHPEWSPIHHQNDALRILSKRLLRNLWREAKRLHEEEQA